MVADTGLISWIVLSTGISTVHSVGLTRHATIFFSSLVQCMSGRVVTGYCHSNVGSGTLSYTLFGCMKSCWLILTGTNLIDLGGKWTVVFIIHLGCFGARALTVPCMSFFCP